MSHVPKRDLRFSIHSEGYKRSKAANDANRARSLAAKQPPRDKAYVFGYGRVSTTQQEVSIEAQRKQCEDYANYRLIPQGLEWGGWYCDPAVSGKVPLKERKAGAVLCQRLQRGDHVVISKLDRAFRNVFDGMAMIQQWRQLGVVIHFQDLGVDGSTLMGQMMISFYLFFAQMERERISERTKQAKDHIKATSHKLAGYHAQIGVAPLGMRKIKASRKKDWRLVWHEEHIKLLKEVYDLRERTGWTLAQLAAHFRNANTPTIRGGKWSLPIVSKMLTRYEKYLASGDLPEYALPEKSNSPPTTRSTDSSATPSLGISEPPSYCTSAPSATGPPSSPCGPS
jgi:DNA invertase Pin-like site-specific DNA recombinase